MIWYLRNSCQGDNQIFCSILMSETVSCSNYIISTSPLSSSDTNISAAFSLPDVKYCDINMWRCQLAQLHDCVAQNARLLHYLLTWWGKLCHAASNVTVELDDFEFSQDSFHCFEKLPMLITVTVWLKKQIYDAAQSFPSKHFPLRSKLRCSASLAAVLEITLRGFKGR